MIILAAAHRENTRALGLAGFWHSLRHFNQLCGYFYNNCFKNGILPIKVSQEELDRRLMDDAERGANATVSVDLEAQTIQGTDGGTIAFDIIDEGRKHRLLNGIDDIGETLEKVDAISAFESEYGEARPWA